MTRVVGGPAPSQADLDTADLVRELQGTELDRIRDRAAKWRDGMLGLAGLFGAAVLVRGRDSVSGLETWVRWVVGGLLVVAMVSVVTSVLNAMVAAFGWSSRPTPIGPAFGLHERLLAERRRSTRDALRHLKVAAVLMVVSISAITAAAALSFLGPEQVRPSGNTCVHLTLSDGRPMTLTLPRGAQTLAVSGLSSLDMRPC